MKNDTDLQNDGWQTRIPVDDDREPPAPTKHARAKLKTVGDVSHELAKLYREARSGRIKVDDASRLANMLSILSRILSDTQLEERIAALEGQRGNWH